MSFGDLWSDAAPLIGETLGSTAAHPSRGERVILRRPSPHFQDTAQDVTPGELQLVSAALAGATALVLELPVRGTDPVYPAGGGMAGTLQAGARLTIGGEDYTLAADAPTAGATLSVTLTAGLAVPAAEGALATVHPEAVFTFENCHVARRRKADIARPLQADHFAVVTVPAKGAPTAPRMNDHLELEDGTTGRVANQVLGGGAFWKLHLGT